ncbi:MAG: PAS domain S-box protein [Halobacteriota archaeon]|nr:PAS domain S-box protein [Halobacteriota archaeon]
MTGLGNSNVILSAIREKEDDFLDHESNFKSLIENSSDAIVVIGPKGKVVYQSPSYEKILGRKKEDHLGDYAHRYIHPMDLPHMYKLFGRLLRSHETFEKIRLRLKHSDGSWHWIQATAKNHLDDPKINGIVVNFRDITDQKEIEEKLKDTIKKYSAIIDGVREGVIILKDMKVEFASQSVEDITGYSTDEIKNIDPMKVILQKDYNKVVEIFRNIVKESEVIKPQQFQIFHKDGHTLSLELSSKKIKNRRETTDIVFLRDLSLKEEKEKVLKDSEEKYATLVNMSQDGVLLLQHDRIVYANNRFYDILGIDRSSLDGKSIISTLSKSMPDMLSAMSKEDREMLLNRLSDAKKGNITSHSYQVPLKTRSGEICWIEIYVNPIKYKGEPAEIVVFRDVTKFKNYEDKLGRLKEHYRSLIESSPDMIAQFNGSGKIIMANTRMAEFLEVSLEELIGGDALKVMPKELLTRAIELLSTATKCEKPFFFEDYIKGRYYHSVIVPVDIPGEKRTFQMISRDITEHKEAEIEIEVAKKRMEDILEGMIDGITISDMQANILYVNKAATMQTGFQPEELIGKKVMEVYIGKEDFLKAAKHLKKLFTGESLKAEEYSILRKNGPAFPASLNFSLLKDSDGKPENIIAVHRDITERKSMEEELHKSKERYRLVADNLEDIVWSMDMSLKIDYISPSAKTIYGLDPEEALGKPLMSILSKESAESMMNGIKQNPALFKIMMEMISGRIDSGELKNNSDVLSKPIEYEYTRQDGTKLFVESAMSPMIDDGNAVGICGITRDITERVKAEIKVNELMNDLERSNKELEQFAYVASHDLQEPLRMVSSYLTLLSRRYKGKLDSDADDFIHFAVDGATRMQRMINDLLTYSRVGTRGKPFEEVDSETLLKDALSNLEIRIEESSAIVTHDPLPTVMADDVQFVQLLQNLIGNSIKYNDKDTPEVHIGVEDKDGDWLFSVKDNGIGIEPEYIDSVFEIFRRLPTEKEYEGSGIGLSVCKKIVERHGGRIWLESEPGSGTTFYFTVPSLKNEKLEVASVM